MTTKFDLCEYYIPDDEGFVYIESDILRNAAGDKLAWLEENSKSFSLHRVMIPCHDGYGFRATAVIEFQDDDEAMWYRLIFGGNRSKWEHL